MGSFSLQRSLQIHKESTTTVHFGVFKSYRLFLGEFLRVLGPEAVCLQVSKWVSGRSKESTREQEVLSKKGNSVHTSGSAMVVSAV